MGRYSRPSKILAGVLIGIFCINSLAKAEDDDEPDNGIPEPSIATSMPQNGDPFGVRASFAALGVTYGYNYTGDALANVQGGKKRGTAFIGQDELWFEADLEKAWKWKGTTLHFNVYNIFGHEFTDKYVGALTTVSTIDAMPTTRLFELWIEQKYWGDKAAIRFGQLAADEEFMVSQYGEQFINSTFGWTSLIATNLPSGGPTYPLAAPSVRFKFEPDKNTTVLSAAFSGDPGGPGWKRDAERRNPHGVNMDWVDGTLYMFETQYKFNQDKKAVGLPGTFKMGGWYHTGDFEDQLTERHRTGNAGVYAMLDQQIYALPGYAVTEKTKDDSEDSAIERGIGMFMRVSSAPSDRNEVDFYADAGLRFTGFVPSRPDDSFGVAFAYAQISDRAIAADIADNRLVRDYEAVLELNYSIQVLPGWVVKPDFQYIWHPGGNVTDDHDRPVKNAVVWGLRTVVNY